MRLGTRVRECSRAGTGAVRRVGVGALALTLMAHVGSPNVFFVGNAGPYPVTVIIRPPQVVPGLAEITVRIPESQAVGVKRVVVRPVFWATGKRGSPAGDEATRVAAPEPTYTGKLWFMQGGSYSVYVDVEGARGTGTVTVPVAAVATGQLPLSGTLKALLVVLGFVLFFGMLTIVRGAAGESLVPPGAQPDTKRRRSARLATAIALPVLVLATFGGWKWWTGEATAYQRTLYRPLGVSTSIRPGAVGPVFRLEITDSAWLARRITAIIPDHGKMMHLFLIRDSTQDAFAHLHPAMVDSNSFETVLPTLPPGRYRVYGDVVHESGFERTLVSTIDVPATAPGASAAPADADDTFDATARATPLGTGAASDLGDGLRLTSEPVAPPLVAGRPVELRFHLADAAGKPVAAEPYLGMPAHAVVNRRDGSVFIHLHPMGTVSMAAQQAFALRDRGDTTATGRLKLDDPAMAAMGMAMGAPDGRLSFVYEFPKPGAYRMWVQIKQSGKVRTAAYDIGVAASN